MKSEHHRYDISDLAWELLKDYLPRQKGKRGGQACDNRQFINAVIWILRKVPRGGIYRRIMETGKTLISVSADGVVST